MQKTSRRFNEDEVYRRLTDAISHAGSQAKFSATHGISRQYLNDIIQKKRAITKKILDALGLERIIEYCTKRER
jgi:hypothetical protein